MSDPSPEVERLTAERDAALEVASSSFREALTEPLWSDGKAGPSLADLAHVIDYGQANFQVQHAIGDEMRRWMVPPSHRPTCPLDQRPCTSWTCLADVCVDERKPDPTEQSDDREAPDHGGSV